MKSPKIIFSVLFFFCIYGVVSAQSTSEQNKSQTNELKELYDITNSIESCNDEPVVQYNSEFLEMPYTINKTGIHSSNVGNLYVRIKPLNFDNVAPMPGAYSLNQKNSKPLTAFPACLPFSQ